MKTTEITTHNIWLRMRNPLASEIELFMASIACVDPIR